MNLLLSVDFIQFFITFFTMTVASVFEYSSQIRHNTVFLLCIFGVIKISEYNNYALYTP